MKITKETVSIIGACVFALSAGAGAVVGGYDLGQSRMPVEVRYVPLAATTPPAKTVTLTPAPVLPEVLTKNSAVPVIIVPSLPATVSSAAPGPVPSVHSAPATRMESPTAALTGPTATGTPPAPPARTEPPMRPPPATASPPTPKPSAPTLTPTPVKSLPVVTTPSPTNDPSPSSGSPT